MQQGAEGEQHEERRHRSGAAAPPTSAVARMASFAVGDEVVISGGKYNGKTGKVASIAQKTCKILIDGETTGNIYLRQVGKVMASARNSVAAAPLALAAPGPPLPGAAPGVGTGVATSQPPRPNAGAVGAAPKPGPVETKQSVNVHDPAYPAALYLGRALLLSVHKNRAGADVELANARSSLERLGFDVRTCADPSKGDMEALLRDHRNAPWGSHACSFVGIMAHGSMRGAKMSVTAEDDLSVSINKLYEMLNSSNAPELAGKPKVWVVQACRGGGDRLFADADDDLSNTFDGMKLTDDHDYLCVNATPPGELAWRGVFWQNFERITREPGASEQPFQQLFAMTNRKMAEEGYNPPPVTQTLRDAMISAASLTLPPPPPPGTAASAGARRGRGVE